VLIDLVLKSVLSAFPNPSATSTPKFAGRSPLGRVIGVEQWVGREVSSEHIISPMLKGVHWIYIDDTGRDDIGAESIN